MGIAVARVLPGSATLVASRLLRPAVLGIEELPTAAADELADQADEVLNLTDGDPHGLANEVRDLGLSRVPAEYHCEIRRMLNKHAYMWSGHLGEITTAAHRIEVIPGASPIRSQPHRQGPRCLEFEQTEVDKILQQDVI